MCLYVYVSPEIWMYDYALDFVCLRLEGFLLSVLGVVLAEDDGDLGELGAVDAVGRGGYVPVVQQHAPALVATDPVTQVSASHWSKVAGVILCL